jgi:hypothetical protein
MTQFGYLAPTEKPVMSPLFIEALITLLNASMAITNKKGERESPCLTKRKLSKKPEEDLLIKTKNRTDEMQCSIQEQHFSP